MTRSPMITHDRRKNENWKKAETKSKFLEISSKMNFYMVLLFSQNKNNIMSAKLFLKSFKFKNLPSLKFKNSMINRYFKIPQISCFGGIVRLLEDKIEKLTCSVCRSNFEGRIVFQHWKLTCPRALFISLRSGQDRLNMVYKKKTSKKTRFISSWDWSCNVNTSIVQFRSCFQNGYATLTTQNNS